MHQPYYKNRMTGKFILPWVRLHGIKDYYDMAAILEDFPSIHQTFNMVPSLVEQIEDYVKNGVTDEYQDLTLRPAADLEPAEKKFLLQSFFSLNWDHMVFPYVRFRDLLEKRGHDPSSQAMERASRRFSTQDFLDLQMWFNLAWFDPLFKEKDPLLLRLIGKGRDFTEEEKKALMDKQVEVLGMILPEYRKLSERGQIEVSTSPFYHPILPLLCDTQIAQEALPGLPLPRQRFRHPEDARAQIEKAVAYHRRVFGTPPEGMWPSEGSVSEDILPLVSGSGIRWIATDEEILARSMDTHFHRGLGEGGQVPAALYQPHLVEKAGSRLSIIFRDHQLSDLIGFVYSRWDAERAADDLIGRLHRIRNEMPAEEEPPLVSIILDGENAWEHYKNDGRDFLYALYGRLSRDPHLKTVTVSEYLKEHPPKHRLNKLFPGSWINHNFKIWIGHEEDNAAWDLLSETRAFLASCSQDGKSRGPEAVRAAWEEIYVAEGSDWCWWFGEEHNSGMDEKFDQLFRMHLMNVYELMGREIPEHYHIPILREEKKSKLARELVAFVRPIIDGRVTSYYEWLPAGFYDPVAFGGVMHQVDAVVSHIYYGFDLDHLYIRLDTTVPLIGDGALPLSFVVHFLKPHPHRFEIDSLPDGKTRAVLYARDEEPSHPTGTAGEWRKVREVSTVAVGEIVEAGIPFDLLRMSPNEEVQFFLVLRKDGEEIERWPQRGYLSFEVPTEDFEAQRWCV
jgi:alpha-amylase/alpha-mannosidase (GH57 family)